MHPIRCAALGLAAALLLSAAPAVAEGPGREPAGKPGHGFKVLDRNGDSYLDADELAAAREAIFKRLDRDGDGVVSRDEIPDKGHERGGRMFERADADKDGKVTRGEAAAREPEMMRKLDRDGDGRISREELGAAKGRQGPRDHDPKAAFDRMDKNGDGAVSRDELPAKAGERGVRMFEHADADKDGKVTREELERLRAKRPHERRDGGEARPQP